MKHYWMVLSLGILAGIGCGVKSGTMPLYPKSNRDIEREQEMKILDIKPSPRMLFEESKNSTSQQLE